MREMIFRERQEKMSFAEMSTRVIGRILNVESDKAFGGILAQYAMDVFQEDYNVDVLKQKIDALRSAQRSIQANIAYDKRMLSRLDAMGEYYDQEFGEDLMPMRGKPSKK
jgi:hypothetical protein